ncbi:3-dehydroquinate synthase [Rhodohalobacter sp. 614A]|uniref:3-dehydroquinate synthase n=1 Tax=Rhodohalobacter sp. 614A TaxID=2908649 RepID=UPI001F17928F|nr:3-dehydroquinate synthase [Rhodohalobacter sp. 614A]
MKAEITINATSSSYKALVGKNILEESLAEYLDDKNADKLFVLIDENVFKQHWGFIEPVLSGLVKQVHYLEVPQGESSKSIKMWQKTLDFLLNEGIRRNIPIVVIGGGVTGDLGGFTAATALRGVPLIHIPTTVLAMVDSSIGGKTGVNHTTGKNLIGSFYQPDMVIADIHFLSSLPKKEWINGLSEILKYGAIRDDKIFKEAEIFLEPDLSSINPEKLIQLIAKCIQIKADVVEEDEFESGVRAFLNYGHTFAHALEKACDFDTISHGEAVFLGMLAAQKLSTLTGGRLETTKLDLYRSLYAYRISKDELSYERLNEYMKSDKKRTDQHIKFVLLKSWQHPQVKTVENEAFINQAWDVVFDEL